MRTCPRCGAQVEVYLPSCDCGFSWEPQILSAPVATSQFPGEYRPAAPIDVRRRTSVWPWLLGVVVIAIGAWHLICTERLEASIYEYIEPHVGEASINATLQISIQPLSNLVSIDLRIRDAAADKLKPSDRLLIDAMIAYIRSEVEPFLERELSLAARKQVDLYAMAFPYRMALSLDISPGP